MSNAPGAPAELWRRADIVVLAGSFTAGLLLVAIGYWGVSGTRVLSAQMGSVWLASAGVVVSGTGVAAAVASGRRRLSQRRGVVLPDAADVVLEPGATTSAFTREPVTATGMTRFHRPDCSFVAGKAVTAAPVAEHQKANRQPCAVCRP